MVTQIGVRVSEELKASLEELAEQDKRKLSDFIRIALENLVTERKTAERTAR